jgi:hypothetical protein
LFKIQAFRVDGNSAEFCADRAQYGGRAGISGFFHPCGVSGIEEKARGSIEAFLSTGDDQDLVGGAVYAARSVQVLGYGFAERTVAQSLAAG